jgi:hypothetical protein
MLEAALELLFQALICLVMLAAFLSWLSDSR